MFSLHTYLMEKPIADILPYAVAVAFSPMPIAALLLMLLSNKANLNSVAFLIGWVIGLAALIFAVSFLVSSATGADHTAIKRLIDASLGILLLLLSLKELKLRTKTGTPPKIPKWMSAIESFTPLKALAIGLALSTLNFKNTPLGIAVGTTLSRYSEQNQIIGFISYLLIASSTILLPTVGFLLFGARLQGSLENLKNWLVTNNATIMFVLFLILGCTLFSKAFGF